MELTLIPDYRGYLIMILPPGGFLVMGFLTAGKRLLDARLAQQASQPIAQAA
jgi:electron transport complex protein RnfE